MAQQLGPLFFECTWDDLTFYKMEGKYYLRKKSRLTRKMVLTHKAFRKTRYYANLLGIASQIASSIYSDLPIHWRQFWMFRSFTGEAFSLMEEGLSPQEIYTHLWHTYVEYWVLYQHTTGIQLETGRKRQKFHRGKTYQTRLKHRTENPKCRRYLRLIGKNHWRSSYDWTAELVAREEKRIERERKLMWLEEYRAKQKRIEEEQQWGRKQAAIRMVRVPLSWEPFDKEPGETVPEVPAMVNAITTTTGSQDYALAS